LPASPGKTGEACSEPQYLKVNKLGYQERPKNGTFLHELFFSGKAKKLEQELEKQSFCDFSIEEMPDYFRHEHGENHCHR
jgi:hypothetical protein